MPEINLDNLVYEQANFAHSEREPTSMSKLIRSECPFYYQWRDNEGVDFVTFEEGKPESVRFFRYTQDELKRGVDLTKDLPSLQSHEAIDFLRQFLV